MFRKAIVALLLLVAGFSGYFYGALQAPRETVVAAGVNERREVLRYHCPMHPEVTSPRPGTAPCCGMPLEPVYADGTAGVDAAELPAGAIAVSSDQQQLIGVTVGTAEAAAGVAPITAFGRVAADETRIHKLTLGLDGYVIDMAAVTTGSQVAKGQWLASFSTPEARLPISALITASQVLEREERMERTNPASIAAAKAGVALARDRLLALGMSRMQIGEIERSRLPTSTIQVTSPVDGFLLARRATAGQRFDAGLELFEIADLRRVWILADVPVGDAGRVAPGIVAEAKLDGLGTKLRPRISSAVLPQFDPTTQSVTLRLETDNPGFVLRPGMFVDLDLQLPYPPTLLVPSEAVVTSGRHAHVFVESRRGVFQPRAVEVGTRIGSRIAILKGLAPGERIALSGTFLLDSESRIRANAEPHH